jgi:hypothetical protein
MFLIHLLCCTVHTSDGKPPYGEVALMDFIWDGNHNLVHKTAWWWDGMPTVELSKTQVKERAARCGLLLCLACVVYAVSSVIPFGRVVSALKS